MIFLAVHSLVNHMHLACTQYEFSRLYIHFWTITMIVDMWWLCDLHQLNICVCADRRSNALAAGTHTHIFLSWFGQRRRMQRCVDFIVNCLNRLYDCVLNAYSAASKFGRPYMSVCLLHSLDVVAVSRAPSRESNPNSPLPVNATVGKYPTVGCWYVKSNNSLLPNRNAIGSITATYVF